MPRRPNPIPSYRLHKQSGQAVVTLRLPDGGRKDVLLGPYGSDASKVEYERVLAEWRATGGRAVAPAGLIVNELILAFWHHAGAYYRHPDGTPTSELKEIRYSLRDLKALYGHSPAADFGPLALKAVRQRMVEAGLSRKLINKRVDRIKRAFRWAAGEEMVPVTVYQGLRTVPGLVKGRSTARETEPVQSAPEAFVDAVRPYVTPHVWAMISLQRLTGMRPGEVCAMRACDIAVTGRVWLYRPPQHKTAWRGKERVIPLGPRAQAVMREFLTARTGDYLFSPRRAREERFAALRAARKTKVQPSQLSRRKAQPKKVPGERYTVMRYGQAVAKACRKAGVPHWHPNQLRHTHATEVRRRYGLEAAQVVLGHSRADVTQVYAERDLTLAERVAQEMG
jgi:integrase